MDNAHDFTVRLQDLLRRERVALAEFLVALADFDRRRLWMARGHASLFYFLHRELGLSKGAAWYRKTAAELIQRFPEIVEPLREGRLCLTTVVELSKVLTPENRDQVLPRFFQLSKSGAKEIAAEIRPDEAAPHRDVVTAARVPANAPVLALRGVSPDPGHGAVQPANQPAERHAGRPAPAPVAAPVPREGACSVAPLTADASRLHLTVSRGFLRKLEAARAALSHSRPRGSAQEILEAGLDLLLERHATRKGLSAKPRRDPPPSSAPRHIPAHVKRAVWKRDGGRCTWPLENGGVCGSMHRVEFDHVEPLGKGGPSTIDNVRLLCGAPDVSPRSVEESPGRSIT
jgi:hypothetical protein